MNQNNINNYEPNNNSFNSTNNVTNNPNIIEKTKKIDTATLICIILSIIIVAIGFILGLYYIVTSSDTTGTNFFGPLSNLLVLGVGLMIFIFSIIIIAAIWIIYGLVKLIGMLFNKENKKNNKVLNTIIIVILILLLLILIPTNKNKKVDLMETLDVPPSYEYYDYTSYYFISNDNIYYYKLEHNGNYTELYDRLYVMDFEGNNNHILAETDELRYASFYFVYNNEAYYYTMYYDENKKINLTTGEITSLGTNDILLSKTLNQGIINTFFDNAIAGDSYSIFKKIDLRTNTTISKITTNESMAGNKYFFDYDGGNIYYLEDYYSKNPVIYKNNEILYEFTEYDRYNLPEIEFIAVNNEYIYFIQENTIYKLNINNKTIENQFDNELTDLKRISSGTNTDNYFYSDESIYSFNLETDSFELIIDEINKIPEYIYNINDKLIFTENTDNLKYLTEYDNLGSVVIYNKKDENIEKYDNIRKASFDDNYLYLLYNYNNMYHVNKINIYS